MEENKTPTIEDLMAKIKEMEKNTQQWVQKLIQEKKELETQKVFAENVISESRKVANDPKYLLELKLKKPEVANKILETYYDSMDIETYKAENEITDEYIDIDFLAEKKWNEIASKKVAEMIKSSYKKWLGITEENETTFDEIFNDIAGWRNIGEENISKILDYTKNIYETKTWKKDNNENGNKENNNNENKQTKTQLSQEDIDVLIAKQLWLWGNTNNNSKNISENNDKKKLQSFIDSL